MFLRISIDCSPWISQKVLNFHQEQLYITINATKYFQELRVSSIVPIRQFSIDIQFKINITINCRSNLCCQARYQKQHYRISLRIFTTKYLLLQPLFSSPYYSTCCCCLLRKLQLFLSAYRQQHIALAALSLAFLENDIIFRPQVKINETECSQSVSPACQNSARLINFVDKQHAAANNKSKLKVLRKQVVKNFGKEINAKPTNGSIRVQKSIRCSF